MRRADLFSHRLWGIPWTLLAAAASVVAIVYLVLDTSHGTTGPGWVVLRWFHSLCWVFLALGALAMARISLLPPGWAKPLALAGGLAYAVFIVTGVITGTLFH